MDTRHVDPNTVAVWRWQALTFAVVFAVPMVGVALRDGTSAALGALVVYGVVAIATAWLLPAAHYRALQFGLDDHGIVIERGIWWRSRTALPRIRVQHSDVSQGPLQRRYGVATLKLYTAGSRYTKIELSGLEHDEAVALRDALIARGGESGV
jgi:membrane protein YdbS with pleckstrin-like domain